MKLEYVGSMPRVSSKGVSFDDTKPDKYILLSPAIDLIEALSYGPTEATKHLYNTKGKEYSSSELMEALKKHIANLDEVIASRDEKAHNLVQELIDRVETNESLNEDEKKTWLANIDLMRNYYLQFVTNDSAYVCALQALSQQIHDALVKEVSFPMFRNYGLVLHDLVNILENRKSPIDATLSVENIDGALFGKLTIKHR
jgi:hypothetical protein